MYIIYFDEVKDRPYKQRYYWLGALAIPHYLALDLETKVNDISNEIFGSPLLSKDTEFHGNEIICAKKHFEQFGDDKRVDIYKRLLKVIDSSDKLLKIYIRIDSDNFYSTTLKINEMAFMFLAERANGLMKQEKSIGLLIGDYDHEVVDSSIKQLSQYKLNGTLFQSHEITNLIDTVHYTKSHHSRLIQLADIYVHSCQLNFNNQRKPIGIEIKAFIQLLENRFPSKYKIFPSST